MRKFTREVKANRQAMRDAAKIGREAGKRDAANRKRVMVEKFTTEEPDRSSDIF